MRQTTTIVVNLLSMLFAFAASAGEVAYTCNYQLGTAADATRTKIGSVVVAIDVAARTARVGFGKGWFKTISLSVDGTDVKETSPPASGADLGFFYFDLAANSGGFSGGAGANEFFDSCVPTKIADVVDKSMSAASEPNRHEEVQGPAAPLSVQEPSPEAKPKLAAKPGQSETPPAPPLASPIVAPASAARARVQASERSSNESPASIATSQSASSTIPRPQKDTAATALSSADLPSLSAAPPSSTQRSTDGDRDASDSMKASEKPPEPRSTVDVRRNETEPPVSRPPSVASSSAASARATADNNGDSSDTNKSSIAQTESSASPQYEKERTEAALAVPPAGASTTIAKPTVAAAPVVEQCPATLVAKTHEAKITFANASAIITNESIAELKNIAEFARGCANVAIEVGGHTDNFGTLLGNRDLSQRRAEAVVGILIREGIAAEKLRAVGFGQDQPIASNATAAGRRMNRRVEFHITPTSDDTRVP